VLLVLAVPVLALSGCWAEGDWHRQMMGGPPAEPEPAYRGAQLLPPPAALLDPHKPEAPAKGPSLALQAYGNSLSQATGDNSVVPPPPAEQILDLATALTLAGVANPTIALAEEVVQASLAQQLEAQALLLPTLQAGASFNLHRGNLQSSRGIIEDVDRQSIYAGAGASAVGAGTVTIPGVWASAHLADVFWEPQAAQARVAGRRFDSLATRNRVLLEVVNAYLALAGAEARRRALEQSERELAEVVQMTANFAKTGQGRPADADRARSEALLLHVTAQQAEEQAAVAAAELARVLDLDPATRLRAAFPEIPLLQIVDPHAGPEQLVRTALENRPEVGARAADVAAGEVEWRKERVRPLLPFVAVGLSAGEFGGGSDLADSSFGHTRGRVDFDVLAVWSLQNLGLGNLAVQRRQRAGVLQAEAERVRVLDQIRREVAEAHALAAARRAQVDVALRRVQTAAEAYRKDLKRTRNLAPNSYPIQLLDSLHQLTAARQDLIRAQVEYNQAQFQLFVALGQPPTRALPTAGAVPHVPPQGPDILRAGGTGPLVHREGL
jgi:outer membrane protein TolC